MPLPAPGAQVDVAEPAVAATAAAVEAAETEAAEPVPPATDASPPLPPTVTADATAAQSPTPQAEASQEDGEGGKKAKKEKKKKEKKTQKHRRSGRHRHTAAGVAAAGCDAPSQNMCHLRNAVGDGCVALFCPAGHRNPAPLEVLRATSADELRRRAELRRLRAAAAAAADSAGDSDGEEGEVPAPAPLPPPPPSSTVPLVLRCAACAEASAPAEEEAEGKHAEGEGGAGYSGHYCAWCAVHRYEGAAHPARAAVEQHAATCCAGGSGSAAAAADAAAVVSGAAEEGGESCCVDAAAWAAHVRGGIGLRLAALLGRSLEANAEAEASSYAAYAGTSRTAFRELLLAMEGVLEGVGLDVPTVYDDAVCPADADAVAAAADCWERFVTEDDGGSGEAGAAAGGAAAWPVAPVVSEGTGGGEGEGEGEEEEEEHGDAGGRLEWGDAPADEYPSFLMGV